MEGTRQLMTNRKRERERDICDMKYDHWDAGIPTPIATLSQLSVVACSLAL